MNAAAMSDTQVDNLIGENNFLRRLLLHNEVALRCAAAILRTAGSHAEANAFERDAARSRTVRLIVSKT